MRLSLLSYQYMDQITWSNVWVILPKPSWYEFLIGFLIWTLLQSICILQHSPISVWFYPCSYICNCLKLPTKSQINKYSDQYYVGLTITHNILFDISHVSFQCGKYICKYSKYRIIILRIVINIITYNLMKWDKCTSPSFFILSYPFSLSSLGGALPLLSCIHVRAGPIYWGGIYLGKRILRWLYFTCKHVSLL